MTLIQIIRVYVPELCTIHVTQKNSSAAQYDILFVKDTQHVDYKKFPLADLND